MSGTIGKDAFQKKRGELAEQETKLKEQIAILEKQAQELKMEGSGETAKAVEKIQYFSGAEDLSAEQNCLRYRSPERKSLKKGEAA